MAAYGHDDRISIPEVRDTKFSHHHFETDLNSCPSLCHLGTGASWIRRNAIEDWRWLRSDY